MATTCHPILTYRMKLRTQIFAGYVLLALLVVVVGLTGYVSVRLISQSFDSAINQNQPVLTALQKIRFQATALAFSVATPNAAAKVDAQAQAGTASAVASLMTSVAEYQGLIVKYFPLEMEEAKEIQERAEVFVHAVESIGDHNQSAGHKIFHQQQSQLSEALTSLLASTAEAAEGEEEEFHEMQETIEAQSTDHLMAIVTASVLSLLAAILGGAALAGRVARPVAALRLAALRFGQGHLNERVEVDSQNEIGELDSRSTRWPRIYRRRWSHGTMSSRSLNPWLKALWCSMMLDALSGSMARCV